MVFLFLPFFWQVFDLIIDAGSWAFGGVGGGVMVTTLCCQRLLFFSVRSFLFFFKARVLHCLSCSSGYLFIFFKNAFELNLS